MIRDDEHWLAVTDAFHSAAIEGHGWYDALDGLAEATGSRIGELISIGVDSAVHLNLMTNVEPGFHEAFVEAGGGDPAINPRVSAGWKAPILQVLAESDFITPDEHKRHPHYQEFARPWGIPYICLTTLERRANGLIGLAVGRTHEQGHINPQERRAFASIAPHVRSAVRTHVALEGQGDALLAGAMDALSIPAFVCDHRGFVRKLTPAAEQLVASGGGLQLKQGRLHATHGADAKALSDALDAAAMDRERAGAPFAKVIVVRREEKDPAPIVLDVIALPNLQFEFTFAPRLLILVRGAANHENRRSGILKSVYGMTAAETEIALQLSQGKTAEAIAESRNVGVGTVRAQIKTLLAKAGTSRQVELVARLNQL
jgi:DNA-binding CsgD family transcriptional regulator